jgi:hypothetical protein
MSVYAELEVFRESLTGDFIAGVEAERFIAELQAREPEELARWLHDRGVEIIRIHLARGERSQRAKAFSMASRRAFATAAAAGEVELFSLPFVINPEQVRRPLADMTGADCSFVSEGYKTSGNHSLAVAAFFRELANKTGRRKVRTVMSEVECARLLESFIGEPLALTG